MEMNKSLIDFLQQRLVGLSVSKVQFTVWAADESTAKCVWLKDVQVNRHLAVLTFILMPLDENSFNMTRGWKDLLHVFLGKK